MDFTHRLAISYYKTIAVINEDHNIFLVQHQDTGKIYIKKILDVYNLNIYEQLYHHPVLGTPQIIDYCEEDDKLIIIEEYISGYSLKERMSSKSLSVNDILTYMTDLCNILEKLHVMTPAIIHRDIKPSNIIITSYNHAVLLDFNAAKYYSEHSKEDTVLLGTQGYAAPEQYGFGASSPQTDIYSLGIVLKEMVASLSEPGVLFHPIIDKCIKLNPSERYQNITELRHAVSGLNQPKKTYALLNNIRTFLPPGYRTGTPWKMLFASANYLMIFWLCLTLKVENVFGVALWVERFFVLAIMLFIVCGCFNYLNIQRLIPLCKHKNRALHYLGIVILVCIVVFSLLVVLAIIETLFF